MSERVLNDGLESVHEERTSAPLAVASINIIVLVFFGISEVNEKNAARRRDAGLVRCVTTVDPPVRRQ